MAERTVAEKPVTEPKDADAEPVDVQATFSQEQVPVTDGSDGHPDLAVIEDDLWIRRGHIEAQLLAEVDTEPADKQEDNLQPDRIESTVYVVPEDKAAETPTQLAVPSPEAEPIKVEPIVQVAQLVPFRVESDSPVEVEAQAMPDLQMNAAVDQTHELSIQSPLDTAVITNVEAPKPILDVALPELKLPTPNEQTFDVPVAPELVPTDTTVEQYEYVNEPQADMIIPINFDLEESEAVELYVRDTYQESPDDPESLMIPFDEFSHTIETETEPIVHEAPDALESMPDTVQARLVVFKEAAEPEDVVLAETQTIKVEQSVAAFVEVLDALSESDVEEPEAVVEAEMAVAAVYDELLEMIGIDDKEERQELVQAYITTIRQQVVARQEALAAAGHQSQLDHIRHFFIEGHEVISADPAATPFTQNLAHIIKKFTRLLGRLTVRSAEAQV